MNTAPLKAGASGDCTVDVVETTAGFEGLRDDWDRLLLADGRSIFESFEWQRAWWRHFGESRPLLLLHIVVVRRAGDVIGIAPLFIERVQAFGVVDVRRLAFLGRSISDYLDVVALPELRVEVATALARHLSENASAFDVCILEDMTERSPTATALHAALVERGMTSSLVPGDRCPRTQLKRTWPETLASFKLEHRREVQRRRRNFEKHCAFELEIAGGAASIDADIEQFIAMQREHWTRSDDVDDGSLQRFHRDVARDLAARGWTFLAFLRVHGRRIGFVYGFRFKDELAIYLSGTHNTGDLRQLSPGRVLSSLVMEHAIGEALSAVDFMRGPEHYKYELGGVDVVNHTLVLEGGRSLLSAHKHNAWRLSESLRRRVDEEKTLWSHAVGAGGAVSVTSAIHLQDRIGVIWRDGVRKWRSVS
ncbi:MAG: GNAT family N-acetyltransferase [Deltaproteobacteria bacterium]|nr:GNAT family N-acetyltransferase [Deltaproteobacteria bacterium]